MLWGRTESGILRLAAEGAAEGAAGDGGGVAELERAVAGDRDALARLLCDHGARLACRIARRLHRNSFVEFTADDVLQEVFIDAFRGISSFDVARAASFDAWLDKIADHRLAAMLRDRGRLKRGGGQPRRVSDGRDPLHSSALELVGQLADVEAATASQRVARDELVHAVQVGLAALPDEQRRAIQTRYLHERSLESTALELQRTVPAVRGLLHRAKKSLQVALRSTTSWFNGGSS